jgi:aspartate aminotransferase
MSEDITKKFAPWVSKIGLSSIVSISEEVARIEEETKRSIVKFQRGELIGFDTPKFITDAIAEASSKGYTKYPKSGGFPWFKEAVINYLQDTGINSLESKNIICVHGGQEGLQLGFNLFRGRKVLGFSPYWPCLTGNIFPYTDVEFNTISLEEKDGKLIFDPVKLEQALNNVDIFYYNSPHNPTGKVFSKEESEIIDSLCRKKGVVIISDEPYSEIIYDGQKHTSMLEFNNPDTLAVFSFSKKDASTGWRIGYSVSKNTAMIQAMTKGQYTQTAGVSSAIQYGFAEALNNRGKREEWHEELVSGLKERRDVAFKELKKTFPELQKPEGAFYFFPNTGLNENALLKLCLEKGVSLVNGSTFGKEFEGFMRISYSATDKNEIPSGIKRFSQAVEELRAS